VFVLTLCTIVVHLLWPYSDAFAYDQPSQDNACISDVESEFNSLRSNGDGLNIYDSESRLPKDSSSFNFILPENIFWMLKGDIADGVSSHIQGISRKGQYLFLTGNQQGPDGNVKNGSPLLMVAKMESRPKHGPMGTNILEKYQRPNLFKKRDRLVLSQVVKSQKIDSRSYYHPGGIQLLGDYLVLPLEKGLYGPSIILFWDVSNPESPKKLSYEITNRHDRSAGAVGITRLITGALKDKMLMVVAAHGKDVLNFYLSQGTDIKAPDFKLITAWTPDKLGHAKDQKSALWATPLSAYQNTSLVTQCDGKTFLIATVGASNHLIPIPSNNYADLFEIRPDQALKTQVQIFFKQRREFFPQGFKRNEASFVQDLLTKDLDLIFKDLNQLNSTERSNLHLPNFSAGAGIHIASNGHLSLYATTFYRAKKEGMETIGVSEFLNLNEKGPYVELFSGDNFSGESVLLQQFTPWINTQMQDNFVKLIHRLGMDQAIKSVRYHILNESQFKFYNYYASHGASITLAGNGKRNLPMPHIGSARLINKLDTNDLSQGWINLYQECNFFPQFFTRLGKSGILSLTESLGPYKDIEYNHRISSIRYYLPAGQHYNFYQRDRFSGRYFTLIGTGFEEDMDLIESCSSNPDFISDVLLKRGGSTDQAGNRTPASQVKAEKNLSSEKNRSD